MTNTQAAVSSPCMESIEISMVQNGYMVRPYSQNVRFNGHLFNEVFVFRTRAELAGWIAENMPQPHLHLSQP